MSRHISPLVFALFAACSSTQPATQIRVVIEADPAVARDTGRIELEVQGAPVDSPLATTFTQTVTTPRFPLTLAIVPATGDARRQFRVEATALTANGLVVGVVRAQTTFIAQKTLVLRLVLEECCRAIAATCSETQTCRSCQCAADAVTSSELPELDASVLPSGDAGSLVDGSVPSDGAAIDATTVDGGTPGTDASDARAPVLDAGPCHGPGCDPVQQIAMNDQHACALTTGGRIFCWGRDVASETSGLSDPNGAASCGVTGTRCRPTPIEVPREGGRAATALGLGDGFSCALLGGGSVQCWGAGRPKPAGVEPALLTYTDGSNAVNLTRIAVGRCHVLGASPPGLVGWGCTDHGELQTTNATASLGVLISPNRPDIFRAGSFFGCALERAESELMCWGQNDSGQLGPSAPMADAVPVPTNAEIPATEIATGAEHTCVLSQGRVFCAGASATEAVQPFWRQIIVVDGSALHDLTTSSSAGGGLTCGLTGSAAGGATEAGGVRCWGRAVNADTFYPSGTNLVAASRIHANVDSGIVSVATDGATGCALTDSGDVLCWGEGDVGQLGRGAASAGTNVPALVAWPAR